MLHWWNVWQILCHLTNSGQSWWNLWNLRHARWSAAPAGMHWQSIFASQLERSSRWDALRAKRSHAIQGQHSRWSAAESGMPVRSIFAFQVERSGTWDALRAKRSQVLAGQKAQLIGQHRAYFETQGKVLDTGVINPRISSSINRIWV